ncbi:MULTISPECIES: LysE family translocator [Legionella]|uniref:LysE type translocator n=1 Tax=Legionella maceachernii TaxID=466 RepID=A0A0W0VZ04_9GAMM|nr:LysE family translocator [Legionella maceachernii]KTD25225.1 LysE type translocator [Legionella maceachernii]SJZ76803.1 Threonine/homoserine/homoserine lactone efflux protein [Legionella maceachernii]SUP03084.1 Homoserine/homoserine lactone efflux protein [Legionella maceachernii]
MFPDTTQLAFFLTATIILNLTPGSDVLYVASQSLNSFKHGAVATIGIATGIAIYAIASALGLSSVLMQSPFVFNLIKIMGAFYLFYLAWQALNSKSKRITPNKQSISVWKSYKNGVLTNVLNPKVGIFFLTFLPQFVDIERGTVWLQLLTLGGCFVISGTLINFLYVFLFVYLKDRLFSNSSAQKWLNKFTAFIFCALALKVLSAQQH